MTRCFTFDPEQTSIELPDRISDAKVRLIEMHILELINLEMFDVDGVVTGLGLVEVDHETGSIIKRFEEG